MPIAQRYEFYGRAYRGLVEYDLPVDFEAFLADNQPHNERRLEHIVLSSCRYNV